MEMIVSSSKAKQSLHSPQTPAGQLTRGYLVAIVGTVIWSTTAIFIRYLTQTHALPALVLAFWRDLFVFLALGIVFVLFNPPRLKPGRRNLRFLILYGLELSVFNTLWTFSVALNGAAVSTVMAYSSVAYTAILGWRLFGEKLDWTKITAVLLSMIGLVLISGAYDSAAWQLNALGIITGILSGIAFAGYSLLGKESSNREINPWTAMMFTFGVAAIFLLIYNLTAGLLPNGAEASDLMALGDSAAGWGILILLAVGPTIGGYGLYTVSLTYLPASVANLIATMEPAYTAILAYLFLGEHLSPVQLMGSALIVSGVVLLRLTEGSGRVIQLEIGD